MDTRVERQVERILEMSGEERHSVIVRVASPDDKKDVLIDAAASAIQRRNLTLTARDLLPASREVLQAPRSRS